MSGGTDFNRYASARIAQIYGKDAVHRMNPGGHGGTPHWQMVDGVIWLNLRRLVAEKSRKADEALDF